MNKTLKFIGLLAILPLALVALTPDLIGEADAYESEENIIQISNSTLELVSGEEYITPIIVIISVEQ